MLITIFYLLAIYFFLIGTYELMRRYKVLAWIFSIAVPISLSIYWFQAFETDIFHWAKLYSVILAAIWFNSFRFTKFAKFKYIKWGVYLILVLNILEAVLQDISGSTIPHYLNAFAGFLTIITLNKIESINIEKKTGFKEMHWDSMSFAWVIGYTIWNWVFVFLNYPETALNHIAVLGAALTIGFIRPQAWLMARAYTLMIFLMVLYTNSDFFYQYGNGEFLSNEISNLIVAIISVGFMIIFSAYFFVFRKL